MSVTLHPRVLVVEDHEPFRRVICALLRQRSDLLFVAEAADGLTAVEQAAALQPDIVVLDISLPGLNGIEVAGHLRTIVPHAKIVLVTNEVSVDVIEEAFRRGAHAYVHKPRALRDLLPVLEAVMHGGHIASGSLERIAGGHAFASHRHSLLFWSSDAVFVDGFSRFITRALADDAAVLVLVTDAHRDAIRRSLGRPHVDVDSAIDDGRCVFMNGRELLARVMVNGWPSEKRFMDAADDVIRQIPGRRLVACGECAPRLWAQGHFDAAIELERLWDELVADRYRVDSLCAYPAAVRQDHTRPVRRLCAEHTAVEIR